MTFLFYALTQYICSSYSSANSCNHKCQNQMNKLMQHTLPSVNDVTEGITQESPMGDSSHWTYFLCFHSNYNTPSLYHFENSAILAIKSDIVTFIHVKSIKVTSRFNLRKVKKFRQVALSYRKIKNKH